MDLDKKEKYLFAYSKIYSENKRKIEKINKWNENI